MAYKYTTPRGPVAAMDSGPGPCYHLPSLVGQYKHDPRSVHLKGPAYPFGIRMMKDKDSNSPGPCYFPGDKIYRDGKDGTPRYSMSSRHQELKALMTPGPGAYVPKNAGSVAKHMQPAYTFGMCYQNQTSDTTPAPNRYDALPMIGKTSQSDKRCSPAYSLTGRNKIGSFSDDLQKSPGPGTYEVIDTNRYKTKPPNYSLTSRIEMPGDLSLVPGPGAHSPENVWSHKQTQPSFSFGIRHSPYEATLIVAS